MKKLLLGLTICALLAFASAASAQTTTTTTLAPTCANGGIKCDAQCDTNDACPPTPASIVFTGVCVGAPGDKNAVNKPCMYTHCGPATPVCVGGPWTTIGCGGDGACTTTEACVSSNGSAGCGTGYSQCVGKCTNSSTTTTVAPTTTTVTATTTTTTTTL